MENQELMQELDDLFLLGRAAPLYKTDAKFRWMVRAMDRLNESLEGDKPPKLSKVQDALLEVNKAAKEHARFGAIGALKYYENKTKELIAKIAEKTESYPGGFDLPEPEPEPKPKVPLPTPAGNDELMKEDKE